MILNHFQLESNLVFIYIDSYGIKTIMLQCIGCLSILLRAQEAIAWSNSSTMKVVDAILAFTIHSKPKVRKAAQHAICSILKGKINE